VETLQPSPVVLECSAQSGQVFEAGIEMIAERLMPVTLLSPAGGEQYSQGGMLSIQWAADVEEMIQVILELTVDDGRSWYLMLGDGSVEPGDAEYGRYSTRFATRTAPSPRFPATAW
jgi:hypothetical protein